MQPSYGIVVIVANYILAARMVGRYSYEKLVRIYAVGVEARVSIPSC